MECRWGPKSLRTQRLQVQARSVERLKAELAAVVPTSKKSKPLSCPADTIPPLSVPGTPCPSAHHFTSMNALLSIQDALGTARKVSTDKRSQGEECERNRRMSSADRARRRAMLSGMHRLHNMKSLPWTVREGKTSKSEYKGDDEGGRTYQLPRGDIFDKLSYMSPSAQNRGQGSMRNGHKMKERDLNREVKSDQGGDGKDKGARLEDSTNDKGARGGRGAVGTVDIGERKKRRGEGSEATSPNDQDGLSSRFPATPLFTSRRLAALWQSSSVKRPLNSPMPFHQVGNDSRNERYASQKKRKIRTKSTNEQEQQTHEGRGNLLHIFNMYSSV